MTAKPTGKRVEREARLRWVPLARMRTNPLAQRELKLWRVDKLASEFDPEQMEAPTVNLRDDWYYRINGQHRTEAYKKWLGDGNWEDQSVQCWTYEGLTVEEEAEVFLKLNDTLAVTTFEKFRIGVQAGRVDEVDIDRIVRAQGLHIGRDKDAIVAVGALQKVYRLGPAPLARTLRIIRDAYGGAGFKGPVIEGIGMLCHRFNGALDEATAATKLAKALGGMNGLLTGADELRRRTGNPRAHCVAAVAVETYNRGRGGKKLPSWWRADAAAMEPTN